MSDHLLLTITGNDRPGITYRVMEVLEREKATVADLGQSVTYGMLSLSVLVEVGYGAKNLEKNLTTLAVDFKAQGLDLQWHYIPKAPPPRPGGGNFILICVGIDGLSAAFVGDMARELAKNGVNIHRIDTSSGSRRPRALEVAALLPGNLDRKALKKCLFEVSHVHRVDMALLRNDVYRRSKRLIVFDMDSTLIRTEVIDELARAHGVGSEVEALTAQAMNGEVDFHFSLKKRVNLLAGLEVEKMEHILKGLEYTPGVLPFISRIRSLGYKTALLSGGFSFFADALKEKLHLNYAFANELEISEGRLTGELTGQIVDGPGKAFLLKLMAQMENISLEQVVAIGDGANDLPMLSAAGLGIAYHAKAAVVREAQNHMSHGPMTSILYFLGIPLEDKD